MSQNALEKNFFQKLLSDFILKYGSSFPNKYICFAKSSVCSFVVVFFLTCLFFSSVCSWQIMSMSYVTTYFIIETYKIDHISPTTFKISLKAGENVMT